MKRFLLLGSVFVFLAACNREEEVGLADFDASSLEVRVTSLTSTNVSFTLYLDAPTIGPGDACPRLRPSVTATANGVAMSSREDGGRTGSVKGSPCRGATFAGTLPRSSTPIPQIAFELADGETSMKLVTRTLDVERTITPAESPLAAAPGGDVILTWSSKEDDLDATQDFEAAIAYFDPNDPSAPPIEERDIRGLPGSRSPAVTRSMGAIRVALPTEHPKKAAYLKLSTNAAAPIVECSGVASCTALTALAKFETRIRVDGI